MLEAVKVGSGGAVTWLRIPDPSAERGPLRRQAAATQFPSGEGVLYDDGIVYLATKGDSKIRAYSTCDRRIETLYDPGGLGSPVLNGVDNLHVHPKTGDLYVSEDGDDMQVVIVTPGRKLYALCHATGPQHGAPSSAPVLTASEVNGIAFNPAGDRLYFSSQRGFGLGVTYEVAGPFAPASS